MQEVQTLEDLPAPALQHLQLHLFKALQIPARDQQGSELWGSDWCPSLGSSPPSSHCYAKPIQSQITTQGKQ